MGTIGDGAPMSLVLLGSAKASPGVTTATVLLAAARDAGERPLLVEADPDGGVLAARYGLAPEPGLVSAVAAARRGIEPEEIGGHAQEIPGGVPVLVGPAAAEQAQAALAAAGHLVRALRDLEAPVLVDGGRLRAGSPALGLAGVAELVVLVARPHLDEVHPLLHLVQGLRDECRAIELLLVGQRPYPPAEVAAAVGVPLLGVLADDGPAAAALRCGRGSPRTLQRSALVRSALDVSAALTRERVA